jgi:hypothetical protein
LFFAPEILLSVYPRAVLEFSQGWRRAFPSPPPRTCSPEPLLTSLGAHGTHVSFPIDLSVLPPLLLSEHRKHKKPAGNHPAFAWSPRGPRKSVPLTPPRLSHSVSPTRVNFCARWPKAPPSYHLGTASWYIIFRFLARPGVPPGPGAQNPCPVRCECAAPATERVYQALTPETCPFTTPFPVNLSC